MKPDEEGILAACVFIGLAIFLTRVLISLAGG
jgi:hypothetical protein